MDCIKIILKNICCTCLSKDRKLYQLCHMSNGINNLYLLLSLDIEAYKQSFFKDSAYLSICWECKALLQRLSCFREQVCIAQKLLSDIENERISIDSQQSLSTLSSKTLYDIHISPKTTDGFIDCGTIEIKSEYDIDPLSEIKSENSIWFKNDTIITNDNLDTNNELNDDNDNIEPDNFYIEVNIDDKNDIDNKIDIEVKDIVLFGKSEANENIDENTFIKRGIDPARITKGSSEQIVYFKTFQMNEIEMLEYREKKREEINLSRPLYKCTSCIKGFMKECDYSEHYYSLHTKKGDHSVCHICLCYVKCDYLKDHVQSHYHKYRCQLCDYLAYSNGDILRHLRSHHDIMGVRMLTNETSESSRVLNPDLRLQKKKSTKKDFHPRSYKCPECDECFKNTNLRCKHIQKCHREGYTCDICGKKYPYKHYLIKHIKLHETPMPREECKICHKMIRIDVFKNHSLIHTQRETVICVECDKKFVCRASYKHHLKYSQAHISDAAKSVEHFYKFKCSKCDKRYKSKVELRDHFNYQHLGKTQHKCTVCGKAIATKFGLARHIKRVHEDIKEGNKDKICQQCGKAFRDKKCLREHELIHTGERPLSCEICGCTFRQRASLYTHKKRVHKIYPNKKNITHLENTR